MKRTRKASLRILVPCFWSLYLLFATPRPALASQDEQHQLLVPDGEPMPSLQALLTVRMGSIEHLTWSPDGRILAASTSDGAVCLWEPVRGRPTRCLAARGRPAPPITALAFSAQAQWLATGHGDGSVELWRTDGTQVDPPCRMGPISEQVKLGRAIRSLVFATDGSLLAVGAHNGSARRCERAFETAGGSAPGGAKKIEEFGELAAVPSSLFELTASDPSAKRLAVVTSGAVGVWRLPQRERLWSQPVSSLVLSLAMSPDGRLLATGSLNGGLSLWDLDSGRERRLESGHASAVRAVVFSPDSRHLYAGHDDRSISQWDTRSARQTAMLPEKLYSTAIAASPDGLALATGAVDGGITLIETATGTAHKTLRANADWIRAVAFNQDATRLATASDDQQVRVWQRKAGSEAGPEWSLLCSTESLQSGVVRGLAFSPPDGKHLTVVTDSRMVRQLDARTCNQSARLPEQQDWSRSVAYSPDGQRLAIAGDNKLITVLDVGAPERKQVLQGHTQAVVTLAFRPPDGAMLLSGSDDKTARLWDAAAGKELFVFKNQTERVRAVDFSPDGTIAALASAKEVTLWEVQTQRQLGTLPHDRTVTALRFGPRGQLIATATDDGGVRLWDVATRQPQPELTADGEREAVQALDFGRGTDLLAAATLGKVRLWSVGDRKLRFELLQGQAGWATLAPGGRMYRRDTGGLLWQRGAHGGMATVLPPETGRPRLELGVEFQPKADGGQQLGTVTAHITNAAGGGPAYWLAVEAGDLPGRTEFRDRFRLPSPAVQMRLDPGQSIALPMRLFDRTYASGQHSTLPPRIVPLCITLRHAYDDAPDSQCTGELSRQVALPLGPWWWRHGPELLVGTIVLIGLVGAGLALRLRRSLAAHRVVRDALAGRSCLYTLQLHAVPGVHQALQRAETLLPARGLIARALERDGVDAYGWQRARMAARSAELCASKLAESLLAKVGPISRSLGPDVMAFDLSLPSLSIHIPAGVRLVLCTARTMSVPTAIAQCQLAEQKGGPWILLVDLTAAQESPTAVQKSLQDAYPGIVFVVLSESEVLRILLARNPSGAQDALRAALLQQRGAKELCLYQEGGNELKDDRESFFFGRQSELQRLLQQHQRNHLLVGPRFMGKSSLLNAFKRELARHYPSVKVIKHQIPPGSTSLSLIQSVDPALCADSPEQFYRSVMARTSEYQIFLLDEADAFIEHENKTQYPFCSVMRALSGQGRASFVLAGNLELHTATQIPDHPLCNFGDLLRLEPLDEGAAARMILDPLHGLGLQFADEAATVDWLRTQTNCHPRLLAILCSAMLDLPLACSGHAIPLETIKREIRAHRNLRVAFGGWESGYVGPIDRAVTRAALLAGNSHRDELLELLRERRVTLSVAELESCLRRLYAWHYVLIVDPQGLIRCPVPLFEHFLSDPRPASPSGQVWRSREARLSAELAADLQELGGSVHAPAA